jgi:hypothetical protein
MTRTNIKELAQKLGPTAAWPSQIHLWADAFTSMNPEFNRKRFIRIAIEAWEQEYIPPEVDDEIMF